MLTSKILLLSFTFLIAHSYLHAADTTDKSILSQLSSESLTNEELVTILNSSDSNQISSALQQLSRMPERRVRILEMLNSTGKPLSECHRYELLATLQQEIDDSEKAWVELEGNLDRILGLSPRKRFSAEMPKDEDSLEAMSKALKENMAKQQEQIDRRAQKMEELKNCSKEKSMQIMDKNCQMAIQYGWYLKVSKENNAAITLLEKWHEAADELL